jgi:stage II sporulation protein D
MPVLRLFLPAAILVAAVAAQAGTDKQTPSEASPTVRVRLATLGNPSRLTVTGDGIGDSNAAGERVSVEGTIVLSAVGSRVRIGEKSSESFRLEGGALRIGEGRTAREYPGALVVTALRGALSVVNETTLEQYTEGVLAGECPALFQPEAIRAMAIAARSYSFRKAFLTKAELCDTVHCQVYRGLTGVKDSIRQAVADTRGQCALYEGEVIDAVYCSDCGGATEANENAWRGVKPVPYLRSVEDAPEPEGAPYCAVNRNHNWSLSLTRPHLLRLLGKKASDVCLQVVDTTESGRVHQLRIAAGKAESEAAEAASPGKTYLGEEWRRLLGLSAVKSLKFSVKVSDVGVELEGSGFGHGVGLCQFGANGMAKQGAAAAEILKHYYTGVTIGPPPSIEEARSRMERAKMARRSCAR